MSLQYQSLTFRLLCNRYKKCAHEISNLYSKMADPPTAGIIIIGDEILKAQVKDTNSHYMCSLLYKSGVKVKRISVISDKVSQIADEIKSFSDKYTYVITSGGIGPTHDDVTFEALAEAFGQPLHHHPTLVDVVKNHFKIKDSSSPAYKLAHVPEAAVLKFGVNKETGEPLTYPCINLKNVYVFPGSPTFLEKSFGNLYKELFGSNNNFFLKQLYIDAKEEIFAEALSVVSKELPHVTFGSYPNTIHNYYKVRVTIESDNKNETDKAMEKFCSLVPSNILVDYDATPFNESITKYETFLRGCSNRGIYDEVFKKLKDLYNDPMKVALCFDGSIESTVLVHLIHIVTSQFSGKSRLQAIHFKHENSFPDMDHFIKQTVERYGINLLTLDGMPQQAIKGLTFLRPDVTMLLLGLKSDNSRTGEWHHLARSKNVGNIRFECPLIDLKYRDIWNFARSLCLPYCVLYDRGYTSIGNQGDTEPNPNLLNNNGTAHNIYRPAYTLDNPEFERAGRIDKHSVVSDPQTLRM